MANRKRIKLLEYYQRSDERRNYRNSYRERCWDTRVGSVPLSIPRLRMSSYFPSPLEPRRPVEQALLSVVQEAIATSPGGTCRVLSTWRLVRRPRLSEITLSDGTGQKATGVPERHYRQDCSLFTIFYFSIK